MDARRDLLAVLKDKSLGWYRRSISLVMNEGLVCNQCQDSLVMIGSIHY